MVKKLAAFILILVAFGALPKATAAAAYLFLSPSKGSFRVGDAFSVSVRVNTGAVAINAVDARIIYPTNKLEVTRLSKSESVFALWAQEPTLIDSQGVVAFSGGLANPGFTGEAGNLISITFRAKAAGAVEVKFAEGGVYANDGRGTDILAGKISATFNISAKEVPIVPPSIKYPAPPKVASPTHSEKTWVSNANIELNWNKEAAVTGFSYLLDKNPAFTPDNSSEGEHTSKNYQNIEDGIWYFHIKAKNKEGWGSRTDYQINIDTVPPLPFEITVEGGRETKNPQPILRFEAKDETSGIDHYKIKIGEGEFFSWMGDVKTSPFQMPYQAPGIHEITVLAIDKAGNQTQAKETLLVKAIEAPKITIWPESMSNKEIFYVGGSAIAPARILIFIQNEKTEEMIKGATESDSNGAWFYNHSKFLDVGSYKIYVKARNQEGALSGESNIVYVKVISTAIQIGEYRISYETFYTFLFMLLLLIVIVLILFIIWLKYNIRKKNQKLTKETKEAEESVELGFKVLRSKIEEELYKLKKIEKFRILTLDEKKRKEKLLHNLELIEEQIQKEIKDIEKEL